MVGRGPAASAMGQLRSAMRALALAGLAAAQVLARADTFVVQDEAMRMATAVHVEVDPASGDAPIASAGHARDAAARRARRRGS